MTEKIQQNVHGREYKKGVSLSEDLRTLIIRTLKDNGANDVLNTCPRGLITTTSVQFKVSRQCVKKIWEQYCTIGNATCKKRRKNPKYLFSDGDLELIEALLREKPTMSYREISEKLMQYSSIPKHVSKQRISDAVRKRLPSGMFTNKKVRRKQEDRFTDENIRYTQAFITYISHQNPRKLKFFDECGVKVSSCNPTRGMSEKGKRCIEIGKYQQGSNVTLNMLISLDGILYYNFVDGASDTETFVNFWTEAVESLSPNDNATLQPGDIVILDNCPIHKNEGERRVSAFLASMGIELIFLPTYSPDLNVIENCFGLLKSILKQDGLLQIAQENLKVCISEALRRISSADIEKFFRYTGYINT
ncbi:hypothetical protein FSP39_017050 [Pinctada imbricata]|uniref:Tc1-like transposase DDE domain-containing protein n=1 Tax=Pinctada imbricata TaxID=66713 RepID=A0AA88YE49_PINIB|nr:hypothetical protein FSP39_017050 [Pinctada imbricata]